MEETVERRREQRLRYHWPIWFAEDFNEVLSQGQMIDVSSGGAAFTCCDDGNYLYPGQHLTARFSVPCFGADESFDMANYTRTGHVLRVDSLNRFARRIAIQFAEALPFKPGEQVENESDVQQKLKAVTI